MTKTFLKIAATAALWTAIFATIVTALNFQPTTLGSIGASAIATYGALVIVWGRKAVHSLFA